MLVINITKLSNEVIQNLTKQINNNQIDFVEAEKKILEFCNNIGNLILQEVLVGIKEPTMENTIIVDEKVFEYKENRNLSFINRFGDYVSKGRRTYESYDGEKHNPLDDMLGFTNCKLFSPLMSLLQTSYGADEAFGSSSKKLSDVIGFKVSSTAVQNNTEHIGEVIPEAPADFLPKDMHDIPCDLIVVEVDGTTSPQIAEKEGIKGRESLKAPTEYKECNLIVIEKRVENKPISKVYGGKFGTREDFKLYCNEFGKAAGTQKAKSGVFLGDGQRSNWDIADSYFPLFIQILDCMHANEHLYKFAEYIKYEKSSGSIAKLWSKMLLEGKVEDVIQQMITALNRVKKKDFKLAVREINYIRKNKDRMQYKKYKEMGLPVGSGMIESACKLVVGRRFKGNGMRWRKINNANVLRARLAYLNGYLIDYYRGNKQKCVA